MKMLEILYMCPTSLENSAEVESGNEMNWVLGHLCAQMGKTGPGQPPEDGEMRVEVGKKIMSNTNPTDSSQAR